MAPSDSSDQRGPSGGDAGERAHALVRAAASRVYAEAPADFIATRTALVKDAKAAGATAAAQEIGALRKPSVAAWLLNQVAHTQHPVLAELADLGARLRQATSTLDAGAITSLRSARDTVLADLVRAVRQVADDQGQSISASVEAEVRDTGIAALADEAAEEVIRSGTMTRALAYAGFGEVDLSQAAATTSTGVVLTTIPGGRTKSDRAEPVQQATDQPAEGDTNDEVKTEEVDDGADALAEAAAEEERERRIAQAEQAVDAASQEISRRRAALDAARNRGEATRQRLQKLEAQLEGARADDEDAVDKVSQAVAAAERADAELKAARATLADLRGQPDQGQRAERPEPAQ